MWFFLVQTLGALAAAMGLGVLAGWLLFGGSGSSAKRTDATAGTGAADLHGTAPSPTPTGMEVLTSGPETIHATRFDATRFDATGSDGKGFDATESVATGSDGKGSDATESVAAAGPFSLTADLAPLPDRESGTGRLYSELEARTADVARLKAKLRKAVEEIERRTAQVVAAREAHELEHRRVIELESRLDEDRRSEQTALSDQHRLLNLETELEEARNRAGQLATEVEELAMSHAQLQSSTEAERQALTVEAASLRLRTDGALEQLNNFSREVEEFHDEHARHLARSQKLTAELQAKLAVTRSALAGRAPAPSAPSTLVLPIAPLSHSEEHDGLLQLPGMTADIANSLMELGVHSVRDIAAWSSFDVRRIQDWLPEFPNVVEEYQWVDRARVLVRALRDPSAGMVSGV